VQLSRVARQELLREARERVDQARARRDKLQSQFGEMKSVEDELSALIQKKEGDIRDISKKRGRLLRDTEASMKVIEDDILGKCGGMAKKMEAMKPQFETFRDALVGAFKCVVCHNAMVKPTAVMETGESCCEACLGKYMKNTAIAAARTERLAYESELRKVKLDRGDRADTIRGIELGDELIWLQGYDNEEDDLLSSRGKGSRARRATMEVKDKGAADASAAGPDGGSSAPATGAAAATAAGAEPEDDTINLSEVLAFKKRRFLHEEWVALYMSQAAPQSAVSATLSATLNKLSTDHNVKVPGAAGAMAQSRPYFQVYVPDFVRDPTVNVSLRLLDTYSKKLSMVVLNSGVSGTIAKQLAINRKRK
jgi:hypothetical protein